MFQRPQVQRRIQANMFLFHFSSLATQSGPCNRRQAAVCFHKSKQKDGEEPRTNPPRHTTVENLLGNPASSTNYASPGYHTVNCPLKIFVCYPGSPQVDSKRDHCLNRPIKFAPEMFTNSKQTSQLISKVLKMLFS